jgi:hypothetical protein
MLSHQKRKHISLPLTCIFQPLNPTAANDGPEDILNLNAQVCTYVRLFALFSMNSYTQWDMFTLFKQ